MSFISLSCHQWGERAWNVCRHCSGVHACSGLSAAPVASEHDFNNVCLLISDDLEGSWVKLRTTPDNSKGTSFYDFVHGPIKIFICFFSHLMFSLKKKRSCNTNTKLCFERRWCWFDYSTSLKVDVMVLMCPVGQLAARAQLTWRSYNI